MQPARVPSASPKTRGTTTSTIPNSMRHLSHHPQPGNGTSASTKALCAAADHGIPDSAQGMAIGPTGPFTRWKFHGDSGNSHLRANRERGAARQWAAGLVRACHTKTLFLAAAPLSITCSTGSVVSPDGNWIYLNSGSRLIMASRGCRPGVFPNTRDSRDGKDFSFAGHARIFSCQRHQCPPQRRIHFRRGHADSFDFAWGSKTATSCTENGPDRDMSDELNCCARPALRFPWRIGGTDNSSAVSELRSNTDRLARFPLCRSRRRNLSQRPDFSAEAADLMEPVINVGPDADKFAILPLARSKTRPIWGETQYVHRASLFSSWPRFRTVGAMDCRLQNHGFMASFTPGIPTATAWPARSSMPTRTRRPSIDQPGRAPLPGRGGRDEARQWFYHAIDAEISSATDLRSRVQRNRGLGDHISKARSSGMVTIR